LISLGRFSGLFSKCALKSLDNQAGFDSAIPRFEPWRPTNVKALNSLPERFLFSRGSWAYLEN
jgi:hypothetical protein